MAKPVIVVEDDPFTKLIQIVLDSTTPIGRVAAFADLRTFREMGYANVEYYNWAGLFAPAATPVPVIDCNKAGYTAPGPSVSAVYCGAA